MLLDKDDNGHPIQILGIMPGTAQKVTAGISSSRIAIPAGAVAVTFVGKSNDVRYALGDADVVATDDSDFLYGSQGGDRLLIATRNHSHIAFKRADAADVDVEMSFLE
ncbi:hypothetical protein [Magnetospira sp. QH-2]|uniref:hypothetical protein n=1 Tax=Magnetospira sp. (strain QH-2) TaxID=1288970 RepID=UPI0003E81264|nr:hypothetical protein [Magnetospira sp. QH-2]CCQ72749.1 protein of unknown function [Magnetospira sp. QH-2]